MQSRLFLAKLARLTKFYCVVLVVALPLQVSTHLGLPYFTNLQAQAMASKTNKFDRKVSNDIIFFAGLQDDDDDDEKKDSHSFMSTTTRQKTASSAEQKNVTKKNITKKKYSDSAHSKIIDEQKLLQDKLTELRNSYTDASSRTLGLGVFSVVSLAAAVFFGDSHRVFFGSSVLLSALSALGGMMSHGIGRIYLSKYKSTKKKLKKTKTLRAKKSNVDTGHREYLTHLFAIAEGEKKLSNEYNKLLKISSLSGRTERKNIKQVEQLRAMVQQYGPELKNTLVHFAAVFNDYKSLELLKSVRYADINAESDKLGDWFHQPNVYGHYPVDYALKMGSIQALEEILPQVGSGGATATQLSVATMTLPLGPEWTFVEPSLTDKRQRLLQKRIQSRVAAWVHKLAEGLPPIFLYIESGKASLVQQGVPVSNTTSESNFIKLARHIMFEQLDEQMLDQALAEGFDINTVDLYGNTLLHIAMGADNFAAVMLLLQRQASIEIKNIRGTNMEQLLTHNLSTLKQLVGLDLLTQTADGTRVVSDVQLKQKVMDLDHVYRTYKENRREQSCTQLLYSS